MKQFSGIVLAVLNIVVLVILMFCFMSCSSSSRTVIATKDTLYVERFVDRQRFVYDTIESSSRIVEYDIDSSGDWRPKKKIEKTALQRHIQKSEDEEAEIENSFEKYETTEEKISDKSSTWKWFFYGVMAAMLLFLFLLLKR